MRAVAISLAMLVVMLSMPSVAGAGDFGDANEHYEDGRFEQAREGYEAIAARRVSNEQLFYNLGNTYFRLGRLGPAVYNYERALRIEPGFEDAQYNLRVAREVIGERFGSRLKGAEVPPLWVRITTFASIANLSFLLLGLNVLFFGILIGLRFLDDGFVRISLIVTNAFVFASLVITVALLVGQAYFLERVSIGVVLPDQVVMREGADERRAERGLLHPGLRVEIVGSDPGGWLRVRLSNGVDGWVKKQAIGRL